MSKVFRAAVRKLLRFGLSLSLLIILGPADAADIYGRVYDTLRGKTYPEAQVRIATDPARETQSDGQAQFWFKDVAPGVYLVRISLPQRQPVTGRLLVPGGRATTIANLDLAKIDPPEEDDEY